MPLQIPQQYQQRELCLPPPPRYAPFESGVYKFAPGLHQLGKDFGNGAMDGMVFQIDQEFPRFRANYEDARRELHRYHGIVDGSQETVAHITRWIIDQLAAEHPALFRRTQAGSNCQLACTLTGDTLLFDEHAQLLPQSDGGYVSALDALGAQVQEDLAIAQVTRDGDSLIAVHVTAPGHWAPDEKLGKSFIGVHAPVPNMERINNKADQLMRALTEGVCYVRFAWALPTDPRLNHYPQPPTDWPGTRDEWWGRRFDPANPEVYVVVERQVLVGFPDVSAFLFTIRRIFMDIDELTLQQRRGLHAAAAGLTPEVHKYKGISDELLAWLGHA
ncbi:MAG: heme-dependent oxidative N-demethylase subunit alpha family protein [Candidatus Hydrogenedentales bacterium]